MSTVFNRSFAEDKKTLFMWLWHCSCECDKLFNITLIQVYVPTINAEEADVEQFYEDLQDLLELTP